MVLRSIAGFLIHILTASGAALAMLAMILATGGQWTAMFAVLGLALIVDAVDGPLARALNVKDALPRWDGAALDLVVDFTTYVFVPAYAIAANGVLPQSLSLGGAALIVVTGALYFADRKMKTDDNHFLGFPAVWNVVAFYLFLLTPPEWVSMVIVVILSALTFAPIKFVHPVRVQRLRIVNLVMMALWAALSVYALVADLAPDPLAVIALCVIALYFLGAGLVPRTADNE